MSTRIYLTLTAGDLESLVIAGELRGARATSVSAELRAAAPQADEEELEFLAMQEAAVSAAAGQRVLVAAADVDDVFAVPLSRIVSFHLGDSGVAPSADEEIELSWYDISELDEVRRLLSR